MNGDDRISRSQRRISVLSWRFAAASLCRFLLGTVFLLSSISKVTDLRGFEDRLILHSGLSESVAVMVAAFLPWLEATLAFCFLAGKAVREAAAVSASLLVAFVVYAIWQGDETSCRCFLLPDEWQMVHRWPWNLGRNLILLTASVFLVFRHQEVIADGEETS